MVPHAQLEIHIPNVLHNYRYFRSKLKPETKLLILIKANAYGHGAVPFAKAMEDAGADYIAVATVKEGIELRQGGIKLPILILTAGTEMYPEVIEYNLEPGMPNVSSLQKFSEVLKSQGVSKYPVHIKFDTGMHRLGFMEPELPALKEFLLAHPEVEAKSLYTHLAGADSPEHDEFTLGQLSLFERLTSDVLAALPYKPMRHAFNSAGIERFAEKYPQYQYDMARLGIGIYGISYVDDKNMKPSAYYRCPIVQIKTLGPNDGTVGYGRHGKLGPDGKTIATIPVGYADGINRHLSRGAASFEVNGHLCPTIGNVCMDMCMIDITGVGAKVGDTVTIFGDNPTANDLAAILDTIPYEIYTSVPARVKRVVTGI
jgi:alanine racemase